MVPACFPASYSEQGPLRKSLSTAWEQCGTSILSYYDFEIAAGFAVYQAKTQKHNQSGCEGKCGSLWDLFAVFGVSRASVCYFRWSLELDVVKHL